MGRGRLLQLDVPGDRPAGRQQLHAGEHLVRLLDHDRPERRLRPASLVRGRRLVRARRFLSLSPCSISVGHETLKHSMRMLITLLTVLSLSIGLPGLGLSGLESACRAATLSRSAPSARGPAVQGRKKKRRAGPAKAKAKTAAKTDKKKKNDRGFEL
jgi:hypothetical protein